MKLPMRLFAACMITLLSCSKGDNKPEEIPATVQSQMTVETCSICPYYIQTVRLSFQTYYMIGPKASAPGIICDWFTPFIFYDRNGERIDTNADLYAELVKNGKKGKIIFDCP
jgi:hypothetical protein